MTAPSAIDGGEAAITAEYAKDAAAPLAAPEHIALAEWPYSDFGEPGKVTEQKDLLDLDAVQVRFANGARLIVRPTKLKADEVLVQVRVAGGRLALPASSGDLDWAGALLIDGGFGKINFSDTVHVLGSDAWSARVSLKDDALVLAGTTRREDIATELQVLTAALTDPGWETVETKDAIDRAAVGADANSRDPTAAIGRSLPGLIHGPDRRWTAPTGDEIRAARPDDLRRALSTLASGPIEVTVVGDVTVDEAIAAVSASIGALPARADQAAIVRTAPPAPPGATIAIPAQEKPAQATAMLTWRSGGYDGGLDTPTAAAILAMVLRSRVAAGVSTAGAAPLATQVLEIEPDWGLVGVRLAGPSPLVDAGAAAVAKAAADLREREVSAAELDAARQALIADLDQARRTNAFWIDQLSGAASNPRRLYTIRSQEAALERITPAQVMAAAQHILTDQNEWKLTTKPTGG
jgi:zinc protease